MITLWHIWRSKSAIIQTHLNILSSTKRSGSVGVMSWTVSTKVPYFPWPVLEQESQNPTDLTLSPARLASTPHQDIVFDQLSSRVLLHRPRITIFSHTHCNRWLNISSNTPLTRHREQLTHCHVCQSCLCCHDPVVTISQFTIIHDCLLPTLHTQPQMLRFKFIKVSSSRLFLNTKYRQQHYLESWAW